MLPEIIRWKKKIVETQLFEGVSVEKLQELFEDEQSILQQETVRITTDPFSQKLDDYFRLDVKLIFKRNYKRTTSSLVFDLQNVTNRENAGPDAFNANKGQIEEGRQLGLLPTISYKLEF